MQRDCEKDTLFSIAETQPFLFSIKAQMNMCRKEAQVEWYQIFSSVFPFAQNIKLLFCFRSLFCW